jgi:PAS domain S-box-containing protein
MTESDHARIESERNHSEEELQRISVLLRAVADEVTDAIFVKDLSGKYLLFNKAASHLTGKSAAEVLGRDDTAIFDPQSARVVMERDRRVMAPAPISRPRLPTATSTEMSAALSGSPGTSPTGSRPRRRCVTGRNSSGY